MTDSEMLALILENQQKMQKSQHEMQKDLQEMQKSQQEMQKDLQEMQDSITDIKLHLENVTDKNICLLAENYGSLVSELDKNNIVTDQQIAYQIKVNYLMEDVEKLKKEIAVLKGKIA